MTPCSPHYVITHTSEELNSKASLDVTHECSLQSVFLTDFQGIEVRISTPIKKQACLLFFKCGVGEGGLLVRKILLKYFASHRIYQATATKAMTASSGS